MKKELTKQDIFDMFAETDRRLDESIAKSRKESQESRKEFDERIKKLSEQIGGIGNNNGDVAEEFFYNGLANKMSIGKFRFDSIGKRVKEKRKNIEDEFDIILTNSNTVVVTEVKYKFHPDEVGKLLSKKIPNFKKLFPNYKNFKIYGAIAALSLPDDTKNIAIEKGFFVLTQSGENIKLVNDKVKNY